MAIMHNTSIILVERSIRKRGKVTCALVTDGLSERVLVRKLKQGDEQAFAHLVKLYETRVYNMAYRITGSREDAEDITQETFLGIHSSMTRFKGASKLSTWIYRIAMNHCLEHTRRHRPEMLPLLDDVIHSPSSNDPQLSAEQACTSDAIQRALLGLSYEHRQVVVLHELQELTYSEIADSLGIPIGTVKSRLFNAMRRLKDLLTDFASDGE